MKDKIIKKEHGLGGNKTAEIIKEIIAKEFSNPYLNELDDSAVLPFKGDKLIFSSDGFVVSPIFFSGGDIGKLSIAGTVNDIIAQGGKPMYISMSIIVQEGFKISDLKKIISSAAKETKNADVKVVCGDFKVIERKNDDGIFITTSGIGKKEMDISIKNISSGDTVIVSSTIGEHGACIFEERNKLFEKNDLIKSDCRQLLPLFEALKVFKKDIKFMRDPTRGGLAGALIDISEKIGCNISIDQKKIPVLNWVDGLSQITGMDHLYFACEGVMIIVVPSKRSGEILKVLKQKGFKNASEIGKITAEKGNKVEMRTKDGGKRYLSPYDIAQIPRIC